MKKFSTWKRFQVGYTLLEVLIGMVIFALGIMALAQLQGNLTKASSDSNARSVAINIAEENIETARTFDQITGGTGLNAFNNIVSHTSSELRGGIDYAVVATVADYYYNPSTGVFGTTKPDSSIVNADMKLLSLTVSWGRDAEGNATQNFQIDESHATTTGLGSGSITLTDAISSITSPSGGKVVFNNTNSELYGPPVDYSPGDNPDIISIQLGENRFKESTTPLPDVFNAQERVETKFDVVTYSQNDLGATFLRREEFIAVACECTLKIPSGETGGLRPTIWNGNEYDEGEFVSKAYGESIRENGVNYQSQYCSVCCRDHHDGGTGTEDIDSDPGSSRYDPFRPASEYMTSGDGASGLIGDHKHYGIGGVGLAAADGDAYFEACRLVRKDGFLRVAQDLRQEGLNSFPADYLDEDTEVGIYSKYVTDAVNIFKVGAVDNYEAFPPDLTTPSNMVPALTFPASTIATASVMSAELDSQQLRARGIYLDYMTDELRAIIACMDGPGSGETCGVPGANSALEVIPFYDVQLTWLARWTEVEPNFPIDVSNDEAIQTGNTHDRGIAQLTSGLGLSYITTKINNGNLGLTGTDPIDPGYISDLAGYTLHALALTVDPPVNISGSEVNGSITSSVAGAKASDVEIEATGGAICNRTNTGFECIVPALAVNPRIIVSNYYKRNTTLVACSDVLDVHETPHTGDTVDQNWTRFNLPFTDALAANIVIREGGCP